MSGFLLFKPTGGGSGSGSANLVVSSQTTTFTASTSVDLYLCSSSGGVYTITLPAAAGNTGKVFVFKKTTNDFNYITIATSTPTTIARLLVNGESRTLVSDGSTWVVLDKIDSSTWASYTPTFTGFGTPTNVTFYWRKDVSDCLILARFTAGTSTNTEGRITIPSGPTISSIITANSVIGSYFNGDSQTEHGGPVLAQPSLTYINFGARGVFSNTTVAALTRASVDGPGADEILLSNQTMSFQARIPITDWDL